MPKRAPNASMDAIHEQTPPHNIDAEESVLGGAMLDSRACNRLLPILKPRDFYRASHRTIYGAMLELTAEHVAVDMVTLSERLRRQGALADVGGATFIAELVNRVPTAANAEHYAKIVQEKSTRRDVIQAGTQVVLDAYAGTDLNAFLTDSEQRMLTVLRRKTAAVVSSAQETVAATMRYLVQEETPIIPTGIGTFDRKYGGIARGRVYAIGALTNIGKSIFLRRLMRGVLEAGYSVLDLSLEMSKEELAIRFAADMTGIENRRIAAGMKFLAEDEQVRVTAALNRIYTEWIDTRRWDVVDENRPWPELLELCYASAATNPKLRFIGIDYLQLLDGIKARDRRQEVSLVTRQVKTLARRTNMIIGEVSQLQRPEKKPGPRPRRRAAVELPPTVHDFAESASVERDADMVFLLWKRGTTSSAMGTVDARELNIEIPKCRFGPQWSFSLAHDKEFCRIEDWLDTEVEREVGDAEISIDRDDRAEYVDT